jgi:hypothetical protein
VKKSDLIAQLEPFEEDADIRVRVYEGGDVSSARTASPNPRITNEEGDVLLHVEFVVSEVRLGRRHRPYAAPLNARRGK